MKNAEFHMKKSQTSAGRACHGFILHPSSFILSGK